MSADWRASIQAVLSAPAERSLLLMLALDGAGQLWHATPAGLGERPDSSPEGLRAFLVQLFTSPDFKRVIHNHRERSREPIHAWLYRVDARHGDLTDQRLLLAPEEQDRIAALAESLAGGEVEIEAELLAPFGNHKPYDGSLEYRLLDSEGYQFAVTHHQSATRPGRVRIVGAVQPL